MFFLAVLPAVLLVCQSPPRTAETETGEKPHPITTEEMLTEINPENTGGSAITGQTEEAGLSGSETVSQEVYDQTLAEVKLFIDNLNTIIRSKNFNGWRRALSDEYFATISSRDFLAGASEMPALKIQKIVLRSANDYFEKVVVPSRANSRVDTIDITADGIVKVYHIDEKQSKPLRLYELSKIDNNWTIVN